MANLQLNIEVTDEQLEKLCVENINSLPKEKIEEILLKAIEGALEDKSFLQNLFITHNMYNYNKTPSPYMEKVLDNVDLGSYVNPVAEKVGKYISDNYPKIIEEYVIKAFSQNIFSDINKFIFAEEIMQKVKKDR